MAQTLADLCARLPLALRVAAELAAARPEAPLAELVTELAGRRDRLELLDAGEDPRGAVTSVFSWSCQHLPADAVRMFRLLGLHPGQDWDRYAAAALTDTASLAQAGQMLGDLARAHLIQPAGPGRYQMHDLLRAYAAGLASQPRRRPGHGAQPLTRLFDYYLAAMRRRDGHAWPPPNATSGPARRHQARLSRSLGDRAAARAWLDAELATLTAVAAHTASHGWPGHTIRLAATLYRYLYGSHDTEALSVHAHALAAARRLGDRRAQAAHAGQPRLLPRPAGPLPTGRRLSPAGPCPCPAIPATGPRKPGRWSGLAIVRERQGGYQPGHRLATGKRSPYSASWATRLARSANWATWARSTSGRASYKQAADHAQQVLALAREIDDQNWVARALVLLGEVCCQLGRYPQADDYLRQAVDARPRDRPHADARPRR